MGVGKFFGERKGKEFNELSKEANINPKKAKRRQKISSNSAAVQNLYETCKLVFASTKTGVVPPKDDVERLRSVLDSMKLEDVGLFPEMQYFKAGKDGQQPKINMGIFCLHNHPGMTVFSKLLFGTMHIKSYDWVDDICGTKVTDDTPSKVVEQCTKFDSAVEPNIVVVGKIAAKEPPEVELAKIKAEHPSEVLLAKIMANADFTAPCNTSILYPSKGGNLHCFTAKTAYAVLDVLGPPYSDPDGRHCTYYLEHPFPNFSGNGVPVVAEEEYESHLARRWRGSRRVVGGRSVVQRTQDYRAVAQTMLDNKQ